MKKLNRILLVTILILSMSFIVPETTLPCVGTMDVCASIKKLNVTYVVLIKGNKLNLQLPGVKAKNIKWTSSNNKVATVKKGIVTAQNKAGKAIITAKYKNKKYTCKVFVEIPKISKTSTIIYVGGQIDIKVNKNSQKVKWSSSNMSVAKVTSNGRIFGISIGIVKITAKIGNNLYNCIVVVKDVDNPPLIFDPTY